MARSRPGRHARPIRSGRQRQRDRLVAAPPNTAAAGALGDARRQNRHKAIVFVTRGGRPGLCLSNADAFLKPFGPPVLQVSSDESAAAQQHAAKVPHSTLSPLKRTPPRASTSPATRGPAACQPAAARHHDPAERLVYMRQRARRWHCVLARSDARPSQHAARDATFCSWPRAATSSVISASMRS